MVEMHVFGLALDEESQVPILILKDGDGRFVLPIWIGNMEAVAISMAINKIQVQRPLTHDLFLRLLENLETSLDRVELTALSEGTYYAELVLSTGDRQRRLDSRPSDAIALALRAGVPVLATETLLETVAKGAEKPFQAVLDDAESDKWTEVLAKFDPDGKPYSM
ncbi:MAG: bifunctional nuclease family protein [Deltaproteobacteria bacterium]|nr:bifunctional nuclease family protein [Deltaproteobacteria bacterium]